MAVKVRLTRTGAKNDNCFRVVASDARFPRDGRFIELLGWYDPKKAGKNFNINVERIAHWESKGAQLSDTVRSLLRREKQSALDKPAVEAETGEAEASE
jgi:small subunit ribosomal protein S16